MHRRSRRVLIRISIHRFFQANVSHAFSAHTPLWIHVINRELVRIHYVDAGHRSQEGSDIDAISYRENPYVSTLGLRFDASGHAHHGQQYCCIRISSVWRERHRGNWTDPWYIDDGKQYVCVFLGRDALDTRIAHRMPVVRPRHKIARTIRSVFVLPHPSVA